MLHRTGFPAFAAIAALVASPFPAVANVLFSGPSPLQGRPLVPVGLQASARSLSTGSAGPDTLEVYAFLVDFNPSQPGDAEITGNGTFGSDSSTATPMESWRARRDSTRLHFLRVFQGVSSYWRDASDGKLEVVFRVFPETPGAKPYHVNRTMGQCSPLQGSATNASFDSTYATDILEMVADAARNAAADAAGPFSVPPPTAATRHRAYMLIHAGADRATDGGFKGSSAANTPQDIGSFALGKSDYLSLDDRKHLLDTSYMRDSTGVVLHQPGSDTLRDLLVAAETGSQDGANIGIRGTVSYLVGRALGLPDLWDPAQGVSVMGKFCLMDPAGYSLGNGFLPSLPSAWPRLYMGWATPVEALPSAGNAWYALPAVRPGHDTVLVVPIADQEYLLVENRQRTGNYGTDGSGQVLVRVGNTAGTDSVEFKLVPDSLAGLEADPKRFQGYLYSSSPDAALPGSGLLVWHVNEWLLQQLVRFGSPNSFLGDTLEDRYRGVTLVEASGLPSLGQVFQSATGSTTDVGSGADMLPHKERLSGQVQTITAIGPSGWTNTGSLLGANTLSTLSSPWPSAALSQDGTNSVNGDSVWTPGVNPLSIRVLWGPYTDSTWTFPVALPPAWGCASLLPGPSALPRSLWVLDTAGGAQVLDSAGRGWFTGVDTLKVPQVWDSTSSAFPTRQILDTLTFPWPRLGVAMGRPAASAVLADTLAVRSASGKTSLLWPLVNAFDTSQRDSSRVGQTTWSKAVAGPVVVNGRFWIADTAGNLLSLGTTGAGTPVKTGLRHIQGLCAWGNAPASIAAVDSFGQVATVSSSGTATTWSNAPFKPHVGERFQILSADFTRDSVAGLAVVGSFGTTTILDGKSHAPLPNWPQSFARGDSSLGEPGLAALGDVNGDGKPDLVIPGRDTLWAMDASGVSLTGWPVPIVRTESVAQASGYHPGLLGSSPLVADLGRTGHAEVILGTSDGMLRAWSGNGKTWSGPVVAATPGAASGPTYAAGSWPLSAGGITLDTLRPPWLHTAFQTAGADTRILALSSASSLDAFDLGSARVIWGWAGGDPGRSGSLPDSLLGSVQPLPTGITDFHVFPSPVRNAHATFRWELGQAASSVQLTVWEQTGARTLIRSGLGTDAGPGEVALTGVEWGTGVYAARLEVDWANGGKAQAWVRFGVIR
ncbi:MAG TPA: hypothetical protein VN931_07945 [Fibrobacteria bacterium]|nr:hypothetical protein [Fibrobacteria bacterium]